MSKLPKYVRLDKDDLLNIGDPYIDKLLKFDPNKEYKVYGESINGKCYIVNIDGFNKTWHKKRFIEVIALGVNLSLLMVKT